MIIETVRDADLVADAFKEQNLPRIWQTVDSSWVLNPSVHPTVFSTFDSKFFGAAQKEKQYNYSSGGKLFPMIGREVNYYFQGLIFAAFKQTKQTMLSFVYSWKASYTIQGPVLGEASAWHVPSTNDKFMAILGYEDHPWYLARRGRPEGARGALVHPRSVGAVWQEAGLS